MKFNRKERAIRKLASELGPALVDRYGGLDEFTYGQIKTTLKTLSLDNQYVGYAFALFRYEADQDMIRYHRIDQEFLTILRAEVAELLFDDETSYRTKDVIALTKPREWKGGMQAPNAD